MIELRPAVAERAPHDSELAAVVRAFPAARVLVLGDLILDRYVNGQASRLSPEAPIPVLRPTGTHATLGGAANVALNVATLGGQVWLCGVVGDDAAGAEVGRLLRDQPLIHAGIVTVAGRPTTVKTRFMVGPHQLMRLDEETTQPVDAATGTALLDRFDAALAEAEVIVLSDYAKGVLCDPVLAAALARAKAAGKLVIADPKRADFAAYRGADVLTPNEIEARAATGMDAAEDAGAEQAGRIALAATEGAAVLVSRSARGLTLVRRDRPALHVPTRASEVAEVAGAGDTLIAGLAVALAAGAALRAAAVLANIAAGISVAKQGTATVTAPELLGVLHMRDLVASDSKIASPEAAAMRVAEWHKAGLSVGFANGCFDLIHPGHVRLLTEARAGCDRLIVALNTDDSVRRLKGPTRPVQSETARATVMASLAPVDMVVLFAEDTPREMIALLHPDVLVKGSDYTVETVVGADLVTGWGGRVQLVDLREGFSTTGTIRRMTAVSAS
jgi:D-beta-D-heptose 7-phosphate kinase/D-beta-D-heptose 1-phosphate adenosyltransferase